MNNSGIFYLTYPPLLLVFIHELTVAKFASVRTLIKENKQILKITRSLLTWVGCSSPVRRFFIKT